MKAIVIHEHGQSDTLKYCDVEVPKPGAGEVLVKLEAIGVNRFDLLVRNGHVPNATVSFPHILGVEGAGTVSDIGDGVTGFHVGDRVVPILTISQGICERKICYCMQGHDNICDKFDKLGHTRWGTYAEFVKVNQFSLLALPDEVSFLDAATSLVAYSTAWEMARKVNLRPEDTVLINAVGGAVGSAALQVAQMVGCTIIATAGDDKKLSRSRQHGAQHCINYLTNDLTTEVLDITQGIGCSVVLETVGGEIFRKSLDALSPNGRLSSAGSIEPDEVLVDIRKYLVRRQLVLTGTHFTPKNSIKNVLQLIASDKLRPILARKLPLQEAQTAHQLIESRQFFGNIVLEP